MTKRKKKPKIRKPPTKRRVLRREELSVGREARYIVECAQRRDGRIVTLQGLVFFSTQDGDAWALDPEDNLALCLALEGEQLPYRIAETETRFAIEWNAIYTTNENGFAIEDNSGRVRLFPGYPVEHISDAVSRTKG